MENRGEPQDSFVTSTNNSDDGKAAVSELSDLIESLNTDDQRPRGNDSASFKTSRKKVDEPLPWYPNYLRLSLTIIGANSLKALQNVISFFHHNISRDVKDAYMRPNRAAKVKVLLSEALIYFHMCFSEIKLPLEQDTYLDQMTDLVAMYIDMELKASRRGKESTKKVSCKLSSSLYTFLNSSVDHILDSVLKSRFMVKSFSEICIPVLKKILTPPFQQMYEMTYIRYVLAFKLWKRITTDQEEKKQITYIASSIVPPPRLEEMLQDGLLHDVLPPLRKNKKKLPMTLFFVTTKVNLKETIKEFMKIYRNTKHNDIAAAFDKSMFFKEHRNETNGDDEKDTSTELIDSIWTAFSNTSAVAQDSYSKPNTLCNNKNKKPKKKAKLKKNKKNEKKKKAKNEKIIKKKSKKKKKKIKVIKKKNKNSKILPVKEINKNNKDKILSTIDNLKEKHLPDVATENKENSDNKEDPLMKNLLNVISSLKEDANEDENNFLNSDSRFCEIVDTRSKIAGNRDDNVHNNIGKIETTIFCDNVRTCRILSDIDEKSVEKSDVTPIKESFDKLTLNNFDSLDMKSNFHSLENSNVINSAVTSSEELQITGENNVNRNSDCNDSDAKAEGKESNTTDEEDSYDKKMYNSLPYKIINILDNEMSNKTVNAEELIQKNDLSNVNSKHSEEKICSSEVSNNEVNFCDKTSSDLIPNEKLNYFEPTTPDVVTCDTTDISMEISTSHNNVLRGESNKEISDSMPVDESCRQQKHTVSNKEVVQNMPDDPLSKTSNTLVESSVLKDMESGKENCKMKNQLSYSLKTLHIAEHVLDSSVKASVNLGKTNNTEKSLSSDSENKNNGINFVFQPESACLFTENQHDTSDKDFERATISVTDHQYQQLSPRLSHSVNKVTENVFECVQGLCSKTNQDVNEILNKNYISELKTVKIGTEKLINKTVETFSDSTNPVVNHSQNIDASPTGCEVRNSHTEDNSDINKPSSFNKNKTVAVLSYLHGDYRLSSENSDESADKQHLQVSNLHFKMHCIKEQRNTCKSKNISCNKSLSSHRKSPAILVNCFGHTEQINMHTEDLLDSENCDVSINKKLTQIGQEKTDEKTAVHITDTISKNNKIIVDTNNTLTSPEGQCSLKISYTQEDVCPNILVKSCTKSFEEVSPSTDVGVIQPISSPVSDAAVTEEEQYTLGSCNIRRADKELFALKIKEEKMDLLSNTQKPISSCVEDTSVMEYVKKDMKPDVSSIHNAVIVDVDSSNNTTGNSSMSNFLHQMRLENNPCMKETDTLDSKQTSNGKQGSDKTVILNGKHITSTGDVSVKHAKSIRKNCNVQGIPLSVCDGVQKTTVCNKSNGYHVKTTPKENVNSCAHSKIFSGVSGNKIIEATNSEKVSTNVLQEKNLDISRLEDKTTFNNNTDEKFVVMSAEKHHLVSLREEDKIINECDSSSRSTLLNNNHITKKEKARATVKTNSVDIPLKKQNSENKQVILDTEIPKTKLSSVLNRSSKAECKCTSQKEDLVHQTSSTNANILGQPKMSLSNVITSNHSASPNTASINLGVQKNKSRGKCIRPVAERIPAGSENMITASESNLNIDNYCLNTVMKNRVEENHFSKSQSNCSNDDLSNNFKHHSLDVKSKESNDNQQIISFPANTETEEKESPKSGKSAIFLNPKIYRNNQDDKSNFSDLHKNKLCNTENSDRFRGNICIASSRTDRRELLTEKDTVVSSCHKNCMHVVDKTEKIKYRPNIISYNEQQAENGQTNTSVLPQSIEMYESEQKNKELGVLSLKLNDYSIKKNPSEESSNIASKERKQSNISSVEIVSQSTISDMKPKKGKMSGTHSMSENGNIKNMCTKNNDSRAVKRKINVTEDKLNKGSNVHSKNNSVWRMINLDSPGANDCLPETSYRDRVYKLSERNGSSLDRESIKQSLISSKHNDEDECASIKSNKICKTNSEALDRMYVPIKDSTSSFKMKFVKVPVEKGTVEASDTKYEKQCAGNIDVKKCVIKLDSESLHNKVKKSKSSSLRHCGNEKSKDEVNLVSSPCDVNIETSSLRVENNNNNKLSHAKKYDKSLVTCVQAKAITSREIQCKSLTTTAKGVPLHLENKLCNSSEEVNTTEKLYVDLKKKLSKSDATNKLLVNSSDVQFTRGSLHEGLSNFEKEDGNVSYDTKTKRKRKHSIHSPKKDHHRNNKNNVINTKEAIPVLNLMKLPNNQWSDKSKLDLEPYVKLKKLTEHELLTLTNHATETPVLNLDLHNSGSVPDCGEHSSHEEISEEQISDGVVAKRARLCATFIKFDHEWRIAEPAFITVEVHSENKLNKDTETENVSNDDNDVTVVETVSVVSHKQLRNSSDACHTEENLNKIGGSKTECNVNVQTDSSQNILHQTVGSPDQLPTTKLKTCVQTTVSEKHLFVSQSESDSYCKAQKAATNINKSQKSLQHMKNTSNLTQNTIPNQLYIKSSSKEFTSNLVIDKSEVNEQNSVHKVTSESCVPNSEVKHCTPEIQQSVQRVVFLRQPNSDQTLVSSSAVVPEYMSQVNCQPSTFSHNYSTYSGNLQTEVRCADKPCCQILNEKDNYHLDTSTIVYGNTDNFGRCTEERQNNKISVAASSVINNTATISMENMVSLNSISSVNNCLESTLQHNTMDTQVILHDWTVSNPAVPEVPLDYTVTQSQPMDSWAVLDSRSKNNNDSLQTSTNEIQDLSKLQQVSTDINTYSEYVDRKLNKEKLNFHKQTVNSDFDMCSSLMEYKDYLLLDTSHTDPYPRQIPGDGHHPDIRCCCQLCCRNYHILITNYNKLEYYRSSKITETADKKQRETGEMFTQLEREHNEPDSSLPLKKRKTLTQSTTENKIESYPNTPMISIAELELANYSRSKRLPDPLYNRLGTEPVPSQYVARTNDWNFQNCTEDQNHLPVTTIEPNNLGGHNLMNFVAQNNVSQYIVNGQEETARVKRELKRQKQSLRNEWRIWGGA